MVSGSNLYTGLNLRKLVHDWQDGFHGAPGAQVRLVAHEDDGNPTATKRDVFHGSPKKCRCVYMGIRDILASFLSASIDQRNPFSPDLREKTRIKSVQRK